MTVIFSNRFGYGSFSLSPKVIEIEDHLVDSRCGSRLVAFVYDQLVAIHSCAFDGALTLGYLLINLPVEPPYLLYFVVVSLGGDLQDT
jgi:hypothetical protein